MVMMLAWREAAAVPNATMALGAWFMRVPCQFWLSV
jgi:hypothetical protein